jgi:energy-coupling factor transporter ATP-binding protein EcfA2
MTCGSAQTCRGGPDAIILPCARTNTSSHRVNPSEIRDILPVVRAIRDDGVTILMIEHIMQAVIDHQDRDAVVADRTHHRQDVADLGRVQARQHLVEQHTCAIRAGPTRWRRPARSGRGWVSATSSTSRPPTSRHDVLDHQDRDAVVADRTHHRQDVADLGRVQARQHLCSSWRKAR